MIREVIIGGLKIKVGEAITKWDNHAPCPWCKVWTFRRVDCIEVNDTYTRWAIACYACEASGPAVSRFQNEKDDALEARAWEAWDRCGDESYVQ